MTIGEQIKLQRKAAGMSQSDLRDKIGVKTTQTIQNWEYDRVIPSLVILRKMKELLGWNFKDDAFN